MSADGLRELTNGNAGISNHDYFYCEAYSDDFRQVWNLLLDNGLARHSLMEIENSELFKYSPYKTLNNEQLDAAYDILGWLNRSNNHASKTFAIIDGGAGTGKSILAVYIIKLLIDFANNKEPWSTVEDAAEARRLRRMAGGLVTLRKIGFVVPMSQLRETMKSVFDSVDGLDAEMVLSPESVVNGNYDLLVVDEAHRLYRRHHLPGSHLYRKFDRINRQLMGSAFTGSESDLTELDWIIESSMHIDGCRGCRACYKAGKPCVFGDKDEWNGIAPDLLSADAIVFATPVYWFGWTAQAKAALDRMFCFLPKGEEFRGKKCAFLSAAADGEDVFDAPKMVFEKSVALLGWEVIGEVCAANCGAHGAVRETDCLAQAAALAAFL